MAVSAPDFKRWWGDVCSISLVACLPIIGLALLSGCATSKPATVPTTVPMVRPTPPTPDPVAETPPPEDPTVTEAKKSSDEGVVVIDPGGSAEERRSGLAELAEAERNRRQLMDTPVLVVNDENLAQHAKDGKLTEAHQEAPDESSDSITVQSNEDRAAQETYWRNAVRTARQKWSDTVGSIYELEARANALRLQFYAADDPFYRDARIKPEWDRILDNLATARKEALALEKDVERIVNDGTRVGALPGWLRDGIEIEPEERPYDDAGNAPEPPDSVEPDVAEEYP